jgi:UDP-glucose 4-epimerase
MQRDAYVVGGAGFLGSHLVRHLGANGWRVAVIDPASTPDPGFHAVPAAVSAQSLDALAAEGWRPACVFHLGGSGSVGQAAKDPAADFERTVTSSEVLTRHLEGTRLVFVSSAAVYGDCGETPIAEDHPLQPISHYGTHKAAAEELIVRHAQSKGLSYAIVRFFSLYGAGLRKQLLWDACRKLRDGQPIFDGTGAELRDWMHVSDAVHLLELAARPEHASLVINGGTGTGVRVAHALELLFRALGGTVPPRYTGLVRDGDPRHLVADMRRAQQLGFTASVPLEVGLARYARWFEDEAC